MSAVRKVGGYRSFFSVTHDLDLLLRLEEIGDLHCLQSNLVIRHQHPKSLTWQLVRNQEKNAVFAMLSAITRRSGLRDPIGAVPDRQINFRVFGHCGLDRTVLEKFEELRDLRIVAAIHRMGLQMTASEWLIYFLRYRTNRKSGNPIAEEIVRVLSKFRLAAASNYPYLVARSRFDAQMERITWR
jgi:hypothetical protein